MPTCIYCLVTTNKPRYERREHVMPQAFGSYEPDNPVLWEEVCEECNSTLGKEVETPGARASVEGIHRFYSAKMSGPDSFLKMPKGRVRWEVDEPGWEGLRTFFKKTEDGEDVEIRYLPQVAVTFEDGRRQVFFPDEITDISQFEGAKTYRAFVISLEDRDVIAEALKRVGIEPSWGPVQEMSNNGKDTVSATAYVTYDDITRRLMAKIAFNYLASRLGGPFARKEEFNEIRRFIRYGEGRGEQLVQRTEEPFISEEKGAKGWYLVDDHLVGVRPNIAGGFLGDVAIFNIIHYHVLLSRTGPQSILLGENSFGLSFSWRTNKIFSLLAWGEHNLVQPFSVLAEQYKRARWRRRKV